jgi:hypothetical protein
MGNCVFALKRAGISDNVEEICERGWIHLNISHLCSAFGAATVLQDLREHL